MEVSHVTHFHLMSDSQIKILAAVAFIICLMIKPIETLACAGMMLLCTFVFCISTPRRKEKPQEKKRKDGPGRR